MDRAKVVACLIAIALAGCGGGRGRRVVVGSKNFTEQVILGEILAQQIERAGIPAERKLNLGGTLLAHEALAGGSIDLYPEYTGTALTAVLKQPVSSDPAAVYDRVRAEYEKRWRLAWLKPFGFDNTFAMIVRGDSARQSGLATLSDAARRAAPWTLGAGYEFEQRPDGLAGLEKTYGLRLAGSPLVMDLGLLYQALQSRKVEMVAGSATDAQIARLNVVVLRDDKRYFPPYQCAVVVRDETLARFPALRSALDELSGSLNDEAMRKLNYAVDGQHRSVRDVAKEWLDRRAASRTGR